MRSIYVWSSENQTGSVVEVAADYTVPVQEAQAVCCAATMVSLKARGEPRGVAPVRAAAVELVARVAWAAVGAAWVARVVRAEGSCCTS